MLVDSLLVVDVIDALSLDQLLRFLQLLIRCHCCLPTLPTSHYTYAQWSYFLCRDTFELPIISRISETISETNNLL